MRKLLLAASALMFGLGVMAAPMFAQDDPTPPKEKQESDKPAAELVYKAKIEGMM